MDSFENISDINLCKRLREEGYSKPTEYFWQDKELPYAPAGLRKMKEGKKLNHNMYDDFIFSAPTKQEALDWLIGKNIVYDSSTIIKFGGTQPSKQVVENSAEPEYIPVNIWDDFYEDGYIPEGEIQETYAYVEDSDIPMERRKFYLENLMGFIKSNFEEELDGVEVSMFFYDSWEKYPQFVGTEHEWCLFKRWEIRFKHLSHEALGKILEKLSNINLSCGGTPYKIYSES